MDSDFSPSASNLAGPSRLRPARSTVAAKRKPYARPSVNDGLIRDGPAAPLDNGYGQNEDEDAETQTNPPATPMKRSQSTSTGLLSSFTKALSRPMSWFASPAARNDFLPSSSSTSSLADMAAARDRPMLGGQERQRPSSSGLKRHSNADELDIESHESSLQPAMVKSATMASLSSRLPQSERHRGREESLPAAEYQPPLPFERMASPASARPRPSAPPSASAAVRSYGTRSRLSLGPSMPTESLEQRARAGSVAPSDSISAVGASSNRTPRNARTSMNAPSAFTYGFGSERRVGGLSNDSLSNQSPLSRSFAVPSKPQAQRPIATSSVGPSTHHLPSRSPFAPRSEIGASPSVASGVVRRGTPSRIQQSGEFALSPSSSRAASVLSPSVSGMPARNRTWSALNLAPQRHSRVSDGEELIRDFAAAHRRPATPMSKMESRPGTPVSVTLGKRDATDALGMADLDLAGTRSEMGSQVGSAQKRQMVWDPELGFVSSQELKARNARPEPKNEAEKILSVLEGMRTPLSDARKPVASVDASRSQRQHPSRMMQSISVPLPAPSRERGSATKSRPVGPYRKRQNGVKGDLASVERTQPPVGMRAKLQRPQASQPTPIAASVSDHGDEDMPAEEAMDREVTPPRRVTRGMAKAMAKDLTSPPPTARTPAKARATPSKKTQSVSEAKSGHGKSKLRSARVKRADEQNGIEETVVDEEEVSAPASKPVESLSAETATAAPKRTTKFQVLTSEQQQTGRSSLRQAREKTSRSHGRSGQITAWDSDEENEDENLEDEELAAVDVDQMAKFKLPENLFPDGFNFGGASAKQVLSQQAQSADTEQTDKGTSAETPSANPLLNRLGGFAPPEKQPAQAGEGAPSRPAPNVSSNDAEASKPAFSFGTAPPKASSQAPPSSNFFAKPTENVAAAKDEKKSGPVPNFFGAAGQKETSVKPATVPAAPFSFGNSAASDSAPKTFTKTDSAIPFSFPKPAQSGSTGGFAFKAPEQSQPASVSNSEKSGSTAPQFFGFGNKERQADDTSSKKADRPKPTVSFAQPPANDVQESKKSEPPAERPAAQGAGPKPSSGFSFGAPQRKEGEASSASSNAFGGFTGFGAASGIGAAPSAGSESKKRSADENDESEGAAKKATGNMFSFGQPQKQSPDTASSDGSGKPTTTSAPFSFGAPPTSTAAAPKTGGFSFGASSPAPTSGGFSFKPAATSAAPDASPSPAAAAFTFGGGSGTSDKAQPSSNGGAGPTPSTPFSVNAGSQAGTASHVANSGDAGMMDESPVQQQDAASKAAAPVFGGFGAENKGSASDHPASKAPFTFGATPAAPASSSPFASGNTAESKPFGNSGGFSFGRSSSSAPSQPPASKPFTFGASASTTPSQTPPPTFGGFGGSSTTSAPAAPTSGFSFGSSQQQGPAPGAAASGFGAKPFGSAAPGMSFNFSNPGSESSATSRDGSAPPFQFGGAPANTGPSASNNSSSGFSFGANNSNTTGGGNGMFGAGANGPSSSGSNAPFQFGGSPAPTGSAPPAAPFAFGSVNNNPNPFAAASTPPPTGSPALFNIGAGGGQGSGGPAGGAGGRQVKRLPNRRRA